ncbi:hypothetical protein FCF25_01700 [Haloprofundus sp. MHR1]|nr:hypothetical protein FCF25_01700 [Haloprofundus sp. MHR1]
MIPLFDTQMFEKSDVSGFAIATGARLMVYCERFVKTQFGALVIGALEPPELSSVYVATENGRETNNFERVHFR